MDTNSNQENSENTESSPHKMILDPRTSIGEIILHVRSEQNVTRKDLAEALGITYDRLFDIENDRQFPSVRVSILFCSYFNIERDSFLEILLEKMLAKKQAALINSFKNKVQQYLNEYNASCE